MVIQEVQIYDWCALYFVMPEYFYCHWDIQLFDEINMGMEKAEQQINSLGWLPVAKMWNACKAKGSLQISH